MADESLYISTHEAALALVATAMKKARLRLDTLIINSIMGGIFFTTGGMFHIMLQSHLSSTFNNNPGYVEMLQGFMYPIGLFYVVILGCELFNSNILFFSVAFVRGAVSIFDVLISWFISWWFNLIANIFVCYIICYYSDLFKTESMISASIYILKHKLSFKFHETLIKGITGNFFVSLAIYLQIMAKPIHVKFLLIFLPIFTFVALGFTHSVADMFVLIMGLINNNKNNLDYDNSLTIGKAIWKVFIPGAIGNIIGGSFFGIIIPWYSHIYTVEQDQKLLNLPRYELRDEQPEINTDSRVVKTKTREYENDNNEDDEEDDKGNNKINDFNEKELYVHHPHKNNTSTDSSDSAEEEMSPPQILYNDRRGSIESRTTGMSINTYGTTTTGTGLGLGPSVRPTKSRRQQQQGIRSPKNVFPVYGMGEPLSREKSIASGYLDDGIDPNEEDEEELNNGETKDNDKKKNEAEYMGDRIFSFMSRRFATKTDSSDLEKNIVKKSSSGNLSPRQFSVSSHKSIRNNKRELNDRMISAGINDKTMDQSDNVAGSSFPRFEGV